EGYRLFLTSVEDSCRYYVFSPCTARELLRGACDPSGSAQLLSSPSPASLGTGDYTAGWMRARYAANRYSYNTQRRSCSSVGCPALLRPASSQIPQSARREDQGEAPQPAERPECPDEEKAAWGSSDLAVMCAPHVNNGHGCCE